MPLFGKTTVIGDVSEIKMDTEGVTAWWKR